MKSVQKSEGKRVSDLIKSEYDRAYNYITADSVMNTGAAVVDGELLGQPVKLNGAQYEFVVAADIANATHFVAEQRLESLDATTGKAEDVLLMECGPALVLSTGFPTKDINGATLTSTVYQALLDRMVPKVKVFSDTGLKKTQGLFGG